MLKYSAFRTFKKHSATSPSSMTYLWSGTALLLMCVFMQSPFVSQAKAQFEYQPEKTQTADPAQALDANARLTWNREWSLYASRYTQIGDEFYACANYEPGYPSSSHVTAEALVQRNVRTRTVRISGNMSREIKMTPNLVDAQAAVPALPSLEFGAYGHVHSVQIVKITGPQEMIVRQIWLIDSDKLDDQMDKLKAKAEERSDRRNDRSALIDEIEGNFEFRMQLVDHQRKQRDFKSQGVLIVGYDTAKLKVDERWQGPTGQGLDIAIAGPKTISYTRSGSSRPREIEVVVALPVDQFKGRLSRDEFVKMLATRNLTLQAFIDMSVEEKKNDSTQAVYNTIKRIEENRPKTSDANAKDDSKDNVKKDGKDEVESDHGRRKTRTSRAARRKNRNAAENDKAGEKTQDKAPANEADASDDLD